MARHVPYWPFPFSFPIDRGRVVSDSRLWLFPYDGVSRLAPWSSPTTISWSLMRHAPIGADTAHAIVGSGGLEVQARALRSAKQPTGECPLIARSSSLFRYIGGEISRPSGRIGLHRSEYPGCPDPESMPLRLSVILMLPPHP